MEEQIENQFLIEVEGIVDSLKLNENEGYLPMFEAVVNSIQSIEDTDDIKNGLIKITILRDQEQQAIIKGSTNLPIKGFEIWDDGPGFNDRNYKSFRTAYTGLKREKGCKGIGRFLWLKRFSDVEIKSVYVEGLKKYERSFTFNRQGTHNEKNILVDNDQEVCTIVRLNNFDYRERDKTGSYKQTKTIARRILEHCLSYYIHESVPKIIVEDQKSIENYKKYELNPLFDLIRGHITTESDIFVGDHSFTLNHVCMYESSIDMNKVVYCGNYREVKIEKPERILGSKKLFDSSGNPYVYAAYVSGEYLDKNVDNTRTDFDIPKTQQRSYDSLSDNPSYEDISKEIEKRIKSHLSDAVEIVKTQKWERLTKFLNEDSTNPHATIKFYFNDILEEITPNISDDELGIIIDSYRRKFEKELEEQTRKVTLGKLDTLEEMRDLIPSLMEKVDAAKKDDLARYILHRKMVLDFLQKSLGVKEDGKYECEDVLHNAIFPKNSNSEVVLDNVMNLWIIDDRLTFHTYASSDEAVEYESGKGRGRPDILVYPDLEEEGIARSVGIVELKRPLRGDKNFDIVKQLFGYVNDIKEKKMLTGSTKRPIHTDESTMFYCYGICDITPDIEEDLEQRKYSRLPGKLGYFDYNGDKRVHMEILAYDQLIPDANKRNKIFFKKLGIENFNKNNYEKGGNM